MLRDLVEDPDLKQELLTILEIQMASASMLAVEGGLLPEGIPVVHEDHIAFLERRIDEMDASLEPLQALIIPGGYPAVSQAHIARTVCRRTERTILRLGDQSELDPVIIRFYNRLSDYFFVISRKIAQLKGIPNKPWKSGL